MVLAGVSQRTDVWYRLPKDLADLARACTQILPDGVRYVPVDNTFEGPVFLDPGGGYLYCIGRFWYRINLTTLTAERLTSTPMPVPYDECRFFGVSAHYGMVAWLQGTLYRISIDEAAMPRAGDPIHF
jgi:hypothetical protein